MTPNHQPQNQITQNQMQQSMQAYSSVLPSFNSQVFNTSGPHLLNYNIPNSYYNQGIGRGVCEHITVNNITKSFETLAKTKIPTLSFTKNSPHDSTSTTIHTNIIRSTKKEIKMQFVQYTNAKKCWNRGPSNISNNFNN